MTTRALLLAVAVAATACTSTTAPQPGLLFAEPTAVAVFRGVTTRSDRNDADPVYPYRPYLAVANAGSNDLSIIDGIDDSLIEAPVPLRGLVYPVAGRPLLLAAAALGDDKPDLLVVVTAGDLPWLGGSRLEVVRTWRSDGRVVGAVELGADVLSLVALPFDPDPVASGRVTLVAALAGEKIAKVTFVRSAEGEGLAIDPAQATVVTSAALGFQPLDLAAIPGERTRVFAASQEPLPGGGVRGVAEIDVTGTPTFTAALDARAPTRLVTAARLAEAVPFTTASFEPQGAFSGQTPVDRVYAVLDESGCGLHAAIGCGLVALDPVARDLVPDPTPAGTSHAPFRAPIPIADAVAIGASGPPRRPPSELEPQYAGTYLRLDLATGPRQTTGVAAVVAGGGALTYVDLARWELPSQQPIFQNVKATVSSTRPARTAGNQFLTLALGDDPSTATTVSHLDAAGLSTSVKVTGGYTPNDRWTVTREGRLPGLSSRRAERVSPAGTTPPQLALQATAGGLVSEVVRVWDPTLGVRAGDVVVVDPVGLGTCRSFEASIAAVEPPSAASPGGRLTLAPRTPTVPDWDRCLDLVATTPAATYLATVRAGDYVLVRGREPAAVHVGRPVPGERFEVAWQDEATLAAACPLPPSRPWQSDWSTSPPACSETCRLGCESLQRARLARRIGYVGEFPAGLGGPALAFTLALEAPAAPVPRDLSLVIDTAEGRAPFRVSPTAGSAVSPRAVVPFDRSPWSPASGARFLVPYAGNAVMDTTPTTRGGSVHTMH